MRNQYQAAFEFQCVDPKGTQKKLVIAETPDRKHLCLTIEEQTNDGKNVEHTAVLLTSEQWDGLTILKHGDLRVEKMEPASTTDE